LKTVDRASGPGVRIPLSPPKPKPCNELQGFFVFPERQRYLDAQGKQKRPDLQDGFGFDRSSIRRKTEIGETNPSLSAKTKALQRVAGLFCFPGATKVFGCTGKTKKAGSAGWFWF
nr:hypothetical protein [Prolixibacteraceae bacterium]